MKQKLGMLALVVAASWALGDSAATVYAGDAPYLNTMDPDAAKVLTDRKKFILEVYQPSAADMNQLDADLSRLLGLHEKYVQDTKLTIERIHLSMTLIATEPGQTSEQSKPMVDRFQEQLSRVYARAPLSLFNVTSKVEAGISKEAAQAGRVRLQEKFAPLLDRTGGRLELRKLDWLLTPAWVPGDRPSIPVSPPQPRKGLSREEFREKYPRVSIQPATPEERAEAEQYNQMLLQNAAKTPPDAKPGQPAQSAHDTPLKPPPANPVTPAPAQPAQPPRVVTPAPMLSEWEGPLQTAIVRFELNDSQKKTAGEIYDYSKKRAEQYRAENEGQFSAARKSNDEARIKELNRGMDVIYDEMIQRIESVATLEQKLKAVARETAKK